jgi:predicted GNAT family acetyltransferase
MADITIRDNPEKKRFDAIVDGELAGYAEYMLAGTLIIFTHTQVKPQFEGKGIGSALVREALDAVRTDGSRDVLPLCPFVKAWIGRHPEYGSLVYAPKPSSVQD